MLNLLKPSTAAAHNNPPPEETKVEPDKPEPKKVGRKSPKPKSCAAGQSVRGATSQGWGRLDGEGDGDPIPSDALGRGGKFGLRPELEELLEFDDLAERWRCSRKTIKKNWPKYGFRPVRVAKRVLIPVSQVIVFEQRMINGERSEKTRRAWGTPGGEEETKPLTPHISPLRKPIKRRRR